MQTCKGSRIWNIVSVKSWGRPRLQGGRRKPREGTQGGPRGRSGGGRKAEPEAPGPSRTSMAHLDPAAHHRAHGYADMPPRQSSPSLLRFHPPFSFHPQTKTNVSIWKCQSHVEKGVGCSWAQSWLDGDEQRRRGRAGEEPARGHVRAAGPVGGNQSVGILDRDNKKRTPPNA